MSDQPNTPQTGHNKNLDPSESIHSEENLHFWNIDDHDELDAKDSDNIIDDIDHLDFSTDDREKLEKLISPQKAVPLSELPNLSPNDDDDISDDPSLLDSDNDEIIEKLKVARDHIDEDATVILTNEEVEELKNTEDPKRNILEKQISEAKAIAKAKTKRTPVEIVATLVCILLLTGLAIYLYQYSSSHLELKSKFDWESNLPVEGEFVTIESAKTGWRKPSTKAKLGVILVPTAVIKISGSQSGALRATFHSDAEGINDNKKAIGDPFLLTFTNGKFSNGSDTIVISCSDGLQEIHKFHGYKSQQETRWTLEIKEAVSANSSTSQFTPIGHAPIEPFIFEN